MRGITDHPDDFDREWAYRRGYAHGAEAVVAALRPHLPEAWLACEVTSWRAQFQPKMTRPAGIPFEVSMPITQPSSSDWVDALSGDASRARCGVARARRASRNRRAMHGHRPNRHSAQRARV
jgi:hypothetical protein